MTSPPPTGKQRKPRTGFLDEADVDVVRNEDLVRRRREQICDAALDLFLEKGFASTTIRDICARSGVNHASIYDYVANKNDALRRLLNQLWFRSDVPLLTDLLSDEDRPLEDALAEYLRETWDKKRKGTLLIYRSIPHMLPEDRAAMREREEKLMAEGGALLSRRAGLPPDDPRGITAANLLVFLSAFAPMRDWLQPRATRGDPLVAAVARGSAVMVTAILEGPEITEEPAD
ncbi:TetR family transcriptional regulator [Haematobacter massiliensis]|uniref:TetR family transcriptional regulator n=1 Tax=Haematobacter massiliensis TaxID=195105 RepID=A0A086Y4P2_9RHOB|nr:TetR/AcrR family transcriptional regulator [Haematobacter massiliensis]KFI29242.1 TetR family transcriptional regulator [Haematobacter massiliensis]OWJ71959.1 TetR family transcriptional regulator [Haematobacter massiliensis]OWJ82175.1 TetR family transcriptional regulator [Haematobacter massiliensis]QBJ25858.1 TetR/AcrR family transcriptional regulator [Haematobacter massiliensis]